MGNLSQELIHCSLFGLDDEEARKHFLDHFRDQIHQFETTMATVYERWVDFDRTFANDHDIFSATIVGTLFSMMARLIISMNLLMIGHITLAGTAKRHAIESIALALLFSKYGLPYLQQAWDGRFSVNKAVDILYRKRNELKLNKESINIMKNNRDRYDKLSHASIIAMYDTIDSDGSKIYLGASFDKAKLPFYEIEVTSRVNLANILINIIDGVTRQMKEWPRFADVRTV